MSIVMALAVAASTGSITLTADERRTTTVASADLDLSGDTGARRLQRRVAIAVSNVCAVGGHTMEEVAWRNNCRAEATERARGQMEQTIAAARLPGPTQLTAR